MTVSIRGEQRWMERDDLVNLAINRMPSEHDYDSAVEALEDMETEQIIEWLGDQGII